MRIVATSHDAFTSKTDSFGEGKFFEGHLSIFGTRWIHGTSTVFLITEKFLIETDVIVCGYVLRKTSKYLDE